MEQLKVRVESLLGEIKKATKKLRLDELSIQLDSLRAEMKKADFWDDNRHAQEVSKQEAELTRRVSPWLELKKQTQELGELAELNDFGLKDEIIVQLDKFQRQLAILKKDLRFSSPYDDHDVILSIYAGAGGTDAQDWAQMLLRMYTRWAEKQSLNVKTVDHSAGEEAGLKSVTIEISGGSFLYGKLAGEQGVHRLVRLSPFNADNLRQTSFAKVGILPKIDKPSEVEIDEKDLKIDVYRAGGHGGQSVNTTDSAVRATHIPTGISVAIQNERSQLQNKETALAILRSRLVALQIEQHAENVAAIKGPNQSAEWGNQIRSYVLHPYKQVKDLRTGYETSDPNAVLDGELNPFISAYLDHSLSA
jgi:peptide chain release factor 2